MCRRRRCLAWKASPAIGVGRWEARCAQNSLARPYTFPTSSAEVLMHLVQVSPGKYSMNQKMNLPLPLRPEIAAQNMHWLSFMNWGSMQSRWCSSPFCRVTQRWCWPKTCIEVLSVHNTDLHFSKSQSSLSWAYFRRSSPCFWLKRGLIWAWRRWNPFRHRAFWMQLSDTSHPRAMGTSNRAIKQVERLDIINFTSSSSMAGVIFCGRPLFLRVSGGLSFQ
jgi:hypothetical protein